MTLASQSYRSQNRRRNMSASRPLFSLRTAALALCAAIAIGGAWWLLRPAPESSDLAADRLATAEVDATGRADGAARDDAAKRTADPPEARRSDSQRGAERAAAPQTLRDIVARNEGGTTAPPEAPAFTLTPRTGGTTPAPATAAIPERPATGNDSAPAGQTRTASPEAPVSKPAVQPAQERATPASPPTTNADLARAFRLQATDPVAARLLATRALDSSALGRAERDRAYELLNSLSKQLFLNVNINPNDPTIDVYTVRAGDNLQKIVREQKLGGDHRLIQRLNGIADPRKLRVGQRLRVPRGDFHAEVIKSEYRLNLYLGEGSERVLVSSFRVGLGESNGTPTGMFKVRPNSKLIDPEWTHPRTGQHFRSNDPNNPIGEHWIGLIGVEERTRSFEGYGIHGTIEPDSIGQDRSLGCVRLLADDVALVYECLTEPGSTVLIR